MKSHTSCKSSTAVKRVLLVLFGTAVGVALSAALLAAWRKPAQKITPADYPALRAKLDFNPRAIYQLDEATSYRLKPSFKGMRETTELPHQTNSRGLLGAEDVNPDPGVKKILFLGDSVTYGTAIAFERVFVSRMQEAAGPGYQLLNAGTPGWSTHQQIAFYEKYMRDIPCTAIVLCFCLNDLVEYEWVYRDEEGFRMSDEVTAAGGLQEINSSLEGLKLLRLRKRFASDERTAKMASFYNATLRAWDADHWKTYAERTLAPWLRRQKQPPVIVIALPTRAQISAIAAGAPKADVLFPQEKLRQLCHAEGVTCIDPTEDLAQGRSPDDADRLFLGDENDPMNDNLHFTEEGHAVMAEYLWPRLKQIVESSNVR